MHKILKKIAKDPLFKNAITLYDDLPETLRSSEILKYNKPKVKNDEESEYIYQSLHFRVPPKVFLPGGASKVIFDYLYKDSTKLKGKNYLIMGCGAGVEAVIAALKKANSIYAVDIDFHSIKATKYNYKTNINKKIKSKFHPIISNLFDFVSNDFQLKFDLITFNPPAVSIRISSDKDIIRNVCLGADIVCWFSSQIKEKNILSSNGEIFVTLSNTSELKKIISHAIILGFIPRIVWSKNYKNLKMYLFELSLNKIGDA